jgi:hypothetical protein
MTTMPPFRYGVECEGPHVGEATLVLLSVRYQKPEVVSRELRRIGKAASHLWLQAQPDERFDWADVAALVALGYRATLLARGPADLPPPAVRASVAVCWLVPADCVDLAMAATHLTVHNGPGAFDGHQSRLSMVKFNPDDYGKDLVWRS